MANVDKLLKQMKKKKKGGNKLYPFGVQVVIPQYNPGSADVAATTLTFQGSFDKKKLRKMLRGTLAGSFTTNELNYIIDNFAVKLRPVSMDEVLSWAGTDADM